MRPLARKLGATVLLSCCAAMTIAAATPAKAAEARVPLLQNDYVSVERITLAPDQALAPHAGGQRIVYSLSDYTIDWTENGETARKVWRDGEVHAHEAKEHAVRNVGDTIADFLVVARSGEAMPQGGTGPDAAEVAGGYAALLDEIDGTRILRVTLPPGGRQPLHDGRSRVVYSLNGYRVAFEDAEGRRQEVEHSTGEVHWHDAGRHAVENLGEETARFVVFSFE